MTSSDISTYGGRGPLLIAVSWLCFGIGNALIITRVLVAFLSPPDSRYPWDLWPLLVATALAIASQPCLVTAVHNGIGNDAIEGDSRQVAKAIYWQWCYISLAIPSIVFTQLANIALLRQLQDKTKARKRNPITALGIIPVPVAIAVICVIWLRCDPATATQAANPQDHLRCDMSHSLLILLVAQGAFTAVFDFALGAYTLFTYWNLKLRNFEQLKLLLFYMSSFSSGILAVIRSTQVRPLMQSHTALSSASALMIWFHMEQWIAICVFIVPRLRLLITPLRTWKHSADESSHPTAGENHSSNDQESSDDHDVPQAPRNNDSVLPPTIRSRMERLMIYQQMLRNKRRLQIEVTNDVHVEYHEPRPIDTRSETWLLDHDEDDPRMLLRPQPVPIRALPRLGSAHSSTEDTPHAK